MSTIDYSSFGNGRERHLLEIDRNDDRLQITLTNPWGETITAEFSEADAEEISAAVQRVYRNIRMR